MTNQQTYPTATSQRNLVVRRPDFEFDPESIPRFYFRNSSVMTHLISCFNVQISVVETFILKDCSELLFRNEVRNPAIRKELAELIQQESIHGAAHRKFNEVLRTHGYPVASARRLVSDRLAWLEGSENKMLRLATGVAGECMFAAISRLALTRPSFTQGLDPAVRALVLWHCYEELEHKSVSIDAYNDAFGRNWRSYFTRIRGLWVILGIFLGTGFRIRKEFRHADGSQKIRKKYLELFWFMVIDPALLLRIAVGTLPFLSPRFDAGKSRDNSDDLDRYRSIAVRDEWAVTSSSEEHAARVRS